MQINYGAFVTALPLTQRHAGSPSSPYATSTLPRPHKTLTAPATRRATPSATAVQSPENANGNTASNTNPTPDPNNNNNNNNNDNNNQPTTTTRLTAGERARTVVHICNTATLCTASQRHSGIPFGSHVDFIQDPTGNPILLLARNANHTRNLTSEPRCSLFCQPATTAGQDGCRATLVGTITPLDDTPDTEELRATYIDVHPHAQEALQCPDIFSFYRMQVSDVLFVGGYGVISQWVSAVDFSTADPDPLAFVAPEIVTRLNENKEADLKRLSRIFLGVDDVAKCTMTSLDRLGFDLRVRDGEGVTQEYRVAFREAVGNRFDVQSALVKAFQEAWERENGFDETWEGEDVRATVEYAPS